jgi:hypothetical protein
MQTVEAAVNVGQTGTQTNICRLLVTPVLCTDSQENEVTDNEQLKDLEDVP